MIPPAAELSVSRQCAARVVRSSFYYRRQPKCAEELDLLSGSTEFSPNIGSTAAAPLHRGALIGGAGPRPRSGAPAHHPEGRGAEPDQPTLGLPFPHPLPYAFARCSEEEPEMREVTSGHHVACHLRDVPPDVLAHAAGVPVDASAPLP
jgi:hypothetical protein